MPDADDTPEYLRTRISRLSWVFASAIGLLLLSVVSSVVVTEIEAEQIQTDAQLINISGRQRMLSQRIIYLAGEHQAAALDQRAEIAGVLAAAIDDFEAAITLFESSHGGLLAASRTSPEIEALYLAPLPERTAPLDARVRDYIASARAVLADPQDQAALNSLRDIERGGLLADLDRVVTAFESASVARIGFLRQVELYSLVLAVIIVLFEVLFIFRPGYLLLQRNFKALLKRERSLSRARSALTQTNKALEERNRQIDAERDKLNAALIDSETLRDEQAAFTYAVSHDLKSPVNTIQLLLNEISHVLPPDANTDVTELLGLAQNATQRMTMLIEDTLEYACTTRDQTEPEWIDTRTCLNEVLANMRAEIRASKGQIIRGPLEPIFGYRLQVVILIQNLLSNALKYQADGNKARVTISCEKTGDSDTRILRITDNGIGIAPENQARVFGLFQRLHVQSAYPGSGLGLATCQRIALNHTGSIRVQSTPGKGSTFEVTLRKPLLDATHVRKDIAA